MNRRLNARVMCWLCVLVMLSACMAPMLLQAQTAAWTETITLPDRREAGAMDVAKITFQGFSLTEPTSPGQPIVSVNGKPEVIRFPGLEAGFIKFRISKIEWLTDPKVGYDGSPDYKVIVRNQWVEMSPKIYLDGKKGGNANNLRKRYITAQNFEYVKGDSLPPSAIFKIDKNGNYTFTIGVKALTPKTTEERPFDFNFSFGVAGLQASMPEDDAADREAAIRDSIERARRDSIARARAEEEALKNQNTDDIDAAVKQAIENEDAESLMDLIKDHPEVQSVRDARQYLALKMTKELVDSVTYRVDFKFAKWTRAVPAKEDMQVAFSRFGVGLPESALSPRWDEGKVFLRPPRDSMDYVVTAVHRSTPEYKASITLNSVKDNIRFSYRDTTEGARVAIKVKGGNGPYTLFLQRYAEGVFFDIEGSMVIAGDTIVDKDKLGRIYKLGEEGDFRLFIVDSQQLKKTGSGLVHLVPPPPIPPVVWYSALGALGAFLIGFLLYRREKRRKDEELERLLDTRGGSEPKVKRKPKPELAGFWKETAISDLSLHKNFIREISTYLKERPHSKSEKPRIEGVILGTVLKFDFENEQYEVRLDRFRAIEARALDHYEDSSTAEQWPEIREVANDHRDLVKIGWLQVVEGRPMELGDLEQQFQDEQFSELFQLILKIDIVEGKRLCGFFTRTTSGKINNKHDRQEGVTEWMNWDELEDAGYYEFAPKAVRDGEGDGKIKVRLKNQETA